MRFREKSLIVIILALALCSPPVASDPMDSALFPVIPGEEQNGTRVNNLLSDLVALLPLMGVDITYEEGTIFDMVGLSLFTVIDQLASGDTGGFFEIPLIQETLAYSNLSPGDIIISPDEVTTQMPAISHFQTYPGISGTNPSGIQKENG